LGAVLLQKGFIGYPIILIIAAVQIYGGYA